MSIRQTDESAVFYTHSIESAHQHAWRQHLGYAGAVGSCMDVEGYAHSKSHMGMKRNKPIVMTPDDKEWVLVGVELTDAKKVQDTNRPDKFTVVLNLSVQAYTNTMTKAVVPFVFSVYKMAGANYGYMTDRIDYSTSLELSMYAKRWLKAQKVNELPRQFTNGDPTATASIYQSIIYSLIMELEM